jgi:hypothetical protein
MSKGGYTGVRTLNAIKSFHYISVGNKKTKDYRTAFYAATCLLISLFAICTKYYD